MPQNQFLGLEQRCPSGEWFRNSDGLLSMGDAIPDPLAPNEEARMSLRYRALAAVALFLVGLVAYAIVAPQKDATEKPETTMESTRELP